ncbi:HAD family hydrolase [Corynebacterium glutamicum]|uniref:Haloacid dehalogenase n=1 Tax=Corynebacterium glutamicum (strain R) TaxID=340322 RepID=A0AB72V7C5_CORGB|nr:HAD family hydrolase [Corynebacterium glutamicum]BAF53145.1 hypothetical protein cgR_0182 [Corynebacterium glutamicum R]
MKIAAFDFDGTILFPNGIDDRTVEVIHAWQDAGHLAVAATGKSLSAAHYALQEVDLVFDYSVLFTGAVVTDRDGTVLHSRSLETGTVRRIVEDLIEIEGAAVFATMLQGRDVRFSSTVLPEVETSILQDFREITTEEIDDYEFIGIPIWVPGNEELKMRIHDWLRNTYDVGCVINQDFVDIVPTGTTKGAGLEWLWHYLGRKRCEVEIYTFGDSWNDLPMHDLADRSFSFPWSPPGVRVTTDEVIDSVADVLPRLLG